MKKVLCLDYVYMQDQETLVTVCPPTNETEINTLYIHLP